MIVDAHHHLWTRAQYHAIYEAYGRPAMLDPLLRDYSAADMTPLLDSVGVDRTTLIQIETTYAHNVALLDLAEAEDRIGAVIGWADLMDSALDDQLDALSDRPKFRGIRDPLELKPDPEWILQKPVLRGLDSLARRGLIFELLMDKTHWDVAARLAALAPDLSLVVNHFGKPDADSMTGWRAFLRQIAPYPRVMVKLSGVMVLFPQARWGDWTETMIRPFVESLVDALGPGRLMIATDWPVSTLVGAYDRVFNVIRDCISGLSDEERAQILGDNARRLYSIQ